VFLSSLLLSVKKRLTGAGVPCAGTDAELIVGHVLGLKRSGLYVEGRREVSGEEETRALDLAEKRAGRVPLQYLLGECEFMSLRFEVAEGVFIPRPETEVLVEALVERARGLVPGPRRILDVGTGCGVVGICLADRLRPDLMLGTDILPQAVEIAARNAILAKVGGMTRYVVGDRLEFIRAENGGAFEIVACNPPYVRTSDLAGLQPEVRDHEPMVALDGGEDGLDFVGGILHRIPSILMRGGLVGIEIGDGQGGRAKELFEEAGLAGVEVIEDLAGKDRVVIAKG
jgi:release factor glutamine methyltransferase